MQLTDRLSSDLKSALKDGDKTKLTILRMIKSALKNKEIDKGSPLSDDEAMSVFTTYVKRAKDSIEQFRDAGREDLVAKEEEELKILQSYLPTQLSEDEIRAMVQKAIDETGATGPGDFGKVMKPVMAATKGKADGKAVSTLVKKILEER